MMKYRQVAVILVLIALSTAAVSQESWSLQRCIQHALDTSLLIRSARLNQSLSEVQLNQVKQERYPSLNANAGAGFNFGRVINPATNNFETENSFFSNIGASSSMPIYQGGLINNSIKRARVDSEAAYEDLRQTQNDLALQVALSFLSVLFAEENLQNAEATLALSSEQLSQIDKMIAAGSRPENERYDILAQIALDEQSVVQFDNDREVNLLGLKQLLLLEPDYEMTLERPDPNLLDLEALSTYTLSTVYEAALSSQPEVRAQDLRVESAQLGESIAKANLMPRLSLGGSIGTNYSDLAKQPTGFNPILTTTPGVYIDGSSVLFQVEGFEATGFETTPFLDQLDNGLGYGVSLGLSIPIYNSSAARAAVSRAEIATEQQEVNADQLRQTLKSDIQNALAAARAAREALDAAERAFDAAEIAYGNADRRFALGTINNYDLLSARNRLDNARRNRTVSKYDYLFRAAIIEYYLGRGLSLLD